MSKSSSGLGPRMQDITIRFEVTDPKTFDHAHYEARIRRVYDADGGHKTPISIDPAPQFDARDQFWFLSGRYARVD